MDETKDRSHGQCSSNGKEEKKEADQKIANKLLEQGELIDENSKLIDENSQVVDSSDNQDISRADRLPSTSEEIEIEGELEEDEANNSTPEEEQHNRS